RELTIEANVRLDSEEQRAWVHLGNGMHPLQDLPFHRDIDAGPREFMGIGHAPYNIKRFFSPMSFGLISYPGDPDSWYWMLDSRTGGLVRISDRYSNPHLLEGIALTEEYLRRYLGDINAAGMTIDQRVAILLIADLLAIGVNTRC
ncbi:MAG: hypothetical protein FWE48_04800, partial [Coriobacteriia bacterium]|nr:hypothetical protein [Coriobacteriia bacterium]